MRKGNLVFVQGKGLISSIIRYIDGGGKFSHVAIAISDSKVIESDVDTKVAVRPFEPSKYNYIEVVDLGLSLNQRRNVVNSALTMVGTKYDYLQLVWYLLKRVFHLKGNNLLNNPSSVICSELVFIALDEAGILEDLNIKSEFSRGIDLSPNELYDLVKYATN